MQNIHDTTFVNSILPEILSTNHSDSNKQHFPRYTLHGHYPSNRKIYSQGKKKVFSRHIKPKDCESNMPNNVHIGSLAAAVQSTARTVSNMSSRECATVLQNRDSTIQSMGDDPINTCSVPVPSKTETGGDPINTRQPITTTGCNHIHTSLRTTSNHKQPVSITTMNRQDLRSTISNASKQDYEVIHDLDTKNWKSKLKLDGYTAKSNEVLDLIINFIKETLDVCGTDKAHVIQQWSMPSPNISSILSAYVANQSTQGQLPKKWGKSFTAVFNKLRKIIWPKTYKNDRVPEQLTKKRTIFGIRPKVSMEATNAPLTHITLQNTPQDTKSNNTPNRTHIPNMTGSTNNESTPSQSNNTFTTPSPSTRKRKFSTMFEPYYDILNNDTVYVVRIFLPLMKPKTARNLNITMNPLLRQLSISGTYFPSHLIGVECAKHIKLKQPLRSTIYAPKNTNGQFSIAITLPSDIKDTSSTIQSTHDCWGITFVFPRRKIAKDAKVQLVSCFGSTNIRTPRSTASPSSPSTPTTTNQSINVTMRQRTSPTQSPPSTGAIPDDDPKSLIGKSVQIDGKCWGDAWAGQIYDGTIYDCYRSDTDNYTYWKIQYDDVTEDYWLDELREHNMISQNEYEKLKPKSTPPGDNESQNTVTAH